MRRSPSSWLNRGGSAVFSQMESILITSLKVRSCTNSRSIQIRARLCLTANLEALDEYRALCREMDCGFAEEDNYVYSLDSREKLERELSALDQLGFAL